MWWKMFEIISSSVSPYDCISSIYPCICRKTICQKGNGSVKIAARSILMILQKLMSLRLNLFLIRMKHHCSRSNCLHFVYSIDIIMMSRGSEQAIQWCSIINVSSLLKNIFLSSLFLFAWFIYCISIHMPSITNRLQKKASSTMHNNLYNPWFKYIKMKTERLFVIGYFLWNLQDQYECFLSWANGSYRINV